MSISNTTVTVTFTNVVTGTPVVASITTKGVVGEIYVDYGANHLTAVQGTDYLISIASDMLSVTITPQASLLTKIAANGPNIIYVRRTLPLTSQFSYDNAFIRQLLVDEFDRVWMVAQQLDDEVTGYLANYDNSVVTFTNKTIDANTNTITNIDDNEIKAGANINASKIGTGIVSNTEFNYLDGVTSPIQTQINAINGAAISALDPLAPAADRIAYYTGSSAAALTPLTSFMRTLIDDVDAATARATLGIVLGTDAQPHDATLDAMAGVVTSADK